MEDTFSDAWTLDLGKTTELLRKEGVSDDLWEPISTTGENPGKISNHRVAAIGNLIYLYGGLFNNDNQSQSLYVLDTVKSNWKKIISKVCK